MQTLDCQFYQLFIKISFAPHPEGLEAWRPGAWRPGGLEAWGLEAWRAPGREA